MNSKLLKVESLRSVQTLDLWFLSQGTQLQIRIAKKPQETSKLCSSVYSDVKGSFSVLGKKLTRRNLGTAIKVKYI